MKKGYYLVVLDERHYLGETIHNARNSLNKACDKYLTPDNGFNYWIDFYYGIDIKGYDAWMNLDNTDNFI